MFIFLSSEERQQKCVSEDAEQDMANVIPGEGGSRGEGERAEEIKQKAATSEERVELGGKG